ncbi:hypothetical protein LTR56_003477 [Elasticomyces elasticus]|nr:hypothetical protein LTR22_010953 [Elasticomyces elasticus]KAK3655470.1 hypothetical protein LTR56_003477 [Elasticomyces elasticus]KAK4919893.1 hypothetical protein LTR49_012490 [Elasticomyces elasticus]KAK5756725.1 hypothetical protein LTS12_013189 [Elasticomyces elasticus]
MDLSPTTSDTLPEGLNISLTGELNITQDVVGDLDLFFRLSQAGHFKRAQDFFDEALEAYHMLFPILAEYADMLIRCGAFRRAVEKLDSALMASDVSVALATAGEPGYDDLTPVLLHILILSLRIVDFTLSDHEGSAKIRLPLVFPPFIISQASRFIYVMCRLIESQQYPAASVVLSIYLRHGNLSEELSPGLLLQMLPASSATSDTLQLMSMYSMLGIFLEAQNGAQFSSVFGAAAAGPHGVRPMQPVKLTPSSDTSAPSLASSLAQAHLPGTNTAGVSAGPNTIKVSEVRTNIPDSVGSESAAPNVEHEEETSLTAKVREVLQGQTKSINMEYIVDPICTSRAYSHLELAQWDRELLESIAHAKSNETSGHNGPYTVPTALHERLEGVLKRAEEYADLKLLADVLWQRVAITPSQQADDLLRIQNLWEEGGQPLECIKLLVYSSGRFKPPTSTVEFLLRIDNSVFRTSHVPHGAVGVTKGVPVPTFSTHRTLYQRLNQEWQQRLMMSV